MAKTIETKTETITDPPKKKFLTVNERIQVARFWIRAFIAVLALTTLGGIIFYLLGMENDVSETTERILLIVISPIVIVITSVARYFFESGNDLEDHATDANGKPPPQTFEQKVELKAGE
jgi:hypothetical protein